MRPASAPNPFLSSAEPPPATPRAKPAQGRAADTATSAANLTTAASALSSLSAKGRVSITTQGIKGAQQLHGLFELVGDAEGGRLELLTPLGGTVAIMVWTPASALLRRASGELQTFDSAEDMVFAGIGVRLAPTTLVQWLRGEPIEGVALEGLSPDGFRQLGWQISVARETDPAKTVALSGFPKRLTFVQQAASQAEVRLVLDEVVLPAPKPMPMPTPKPQR
jgi:outer membrane biogenesis lipoprotein LolB